MKRTFIDLGLVIILMSITPISCEKNDKDKSDSKCSVSNPAEDLDWLKEEIETVRNDVYSYYAMAIYKGDTVFYYGNCNPAANYSSTIRNCNGDIFGNTNDLYNELTEIEILWKHDDSQCNPQE